MSDVEQLALLKLVLYIPSLYKVSRVSTKELFNAKIAVERVATFFAEGITFVSLKVE